MTADQRPTLYGYWRSSAAYRVRLALAYKQVDHAVAPINLVESQQSQAGYRALNPQGLVPALAIGGDVLTQSLAIIEYLEEIRPAPPLLPAEPLARARVRSAAQVIACDIHPINNLRVLRYLKAQFGRDQAEIDAWARHWIATGLAVLEEFSADFGGRCLYGDAVSLADLCLLPQLYNARRVATDIAGFPRLLAIESRLAVMDFARVAHPDAQPDYIVT